jgi:hypothetical protein
LGFLSPVIWWSKSRSLCHNSVVGLVPCNIYTGASQRRSQLAPSVAGSCTGASHGTAKWLLLWLAPWIRNLTLRIAFNALGIACIGLGHFLSCTKQL